jgi:protein-L-isoaspartate(D-aspartate) O-methyltransferase
MVGEHGAVVGIDHVSELTKASITNLSKSDVPNVYTMITGDGRLGHPPLAPYNAIHVGAAAPDVPPALRSQLAVGGRMIIPVLAPAS